MLEQEQEEYATGGTPPPAYPTLDTNTPIDQGQPTHPYNGTSDDGGQAIHEPDTPTTELLRQQSRVSVYSATSLLGDDIPLHVAAIAFDLKAVEELLIQPAVDAQETDKRGRNAVHNMVKTLCGMDKWDVQRATAKAKLVEIVALMVKAGFDINAKDYSGGRTPLHMVASHPNMADTIKALLMVGARVNVVGGKEQRTALHMAVKSKTLKNVEALVDGGADPDAKDRTGQSPLHLASSGIFIEYIFTCRHISQIYID